MFILDSLLIGSLRFVLDKVVAAAEAEMNDDSALRDQLLEAQMRLELGEITDEEFVETERVLLDAIREIRERRTGAQEDPGELVNRFDDTSYAAVQSDLVVLLDDVMNHDVRREPVVGLVA